MHKLKTVLVTTGVGAVLGVIVATLIAKSYLVWDNTPGAIGQALCNCPELTREVVASVIRAQLVGAAAGGILALVLGVAFVRGRSVAAPAAGATPSAGA